MKIHSIKQLLLVVPEFPPNNSVGGRRWAKFAKYLAKNGVFVNVIAFMPKKSSTNSNWQKDIEHPNIQVHYLPSGYPTILYSTSSNLFLRILKKITYKFISFWDGGIVEDKSIFFRKQFLVKAREIILQKDIKHVVCSGPPHRACFYTSLLKKEFSELKVIIDFRDRWTDGQVYGLQGVSKKAYLKESALEQYTCEHADYILSTYSEVLKELKNKYSIIPENKFVHFSHNYDPNDYDFLNKFSSKAHGGKIKFIYGGTVNTAALNDSILPFLNGIANIKLMNPLLYNSLEISFFCNNPMLNKIVCELNVEDVVSVQQQIDEKMFYEKSSESDFLLIFLGKMWKDLITTKNITYLPFRKPILVFSEKGSVSDMVVENRLGEHFEPFNFDKKFNSYLEQYLKGDIDYNKEYEIEKFSYETATLNLMKLLWHN